MIDQDGIRLRWETLGCKLDERGQRLFAANEVQAAGHGALAIMSEITGLARTTINRCEDDLDEGPLPEARVRRKGGRPKPLNERDPTLVPGLERLAEPATMGDPMHALKWVSKSPAKLAAALVETGHKVSPNTAANCSRKSSNARASSIALRTRVRAIWIATRSSNSSMRKSFRHSRPDSR